MPDESFQEALSVVVVHERELVREKRKKEQLESLKLHQSEIVGELVNQRYQPQERDEQVRAQK